MLLPQFLGSGEVLGAEGGNVTRGAARSRPVASVAPGVPGLTAAERTLKFLAEGPIRNVSFDLLHDIGSMGPAAYLHCVTTRYACQHEGDLGLRSALALVNSGQ